MNPSNPTSASDKGVTDQYAPVFVTANEAIQIEDDVFLTFKDYAEYEQETGHSGPLGPQTCDGDGTTPENGQIDGFEQDSAGENR